MYAKTIALHAARTQALNMVGIWKHLAYEVAQTPAEYCRAWRMSLLWSFVAAELDDRIKHRRANSEAWKKASPSVAQAEWVATALVQHKSEIAYKVDHG